MCLASMQEPTDYAPIKIVRSRVTQYYPCTVDLRWQRSIHSCDSCPYLNARKNPNNPINKIAVCGAIHYGMCTAVKKISPQTIKGGSHSSISVSHPVQRPPFVISSTHGSAKTPPMVRVTPKFPLVAITNHGNVIRVNSRKLNINHPLTIAKISPRIANIPGAKVTQPVNISNVFNKIPVEPFPKFLPKTSLQRGFSLGSKVHHIPIQRIPSAHVPPIRQVQTDQVTEQVTKPQTAGQQIIRPQIPTGQEKSSLHSDSQNSVKPIPHIVRPLVPEKNVVRPQQHSLNNELPARSIPVISVASVVPSTQSIRLPISSEQLVSPSRPTENNVTPVSLGAVTKTTPSPSVPVTATVTVPQPRNAIQITPKGVSKEKELISSKESNKIDSLTEGDSFLIQKQKEKREREKQKEREAEQAREQQIRNKYGAGESKSVEQLKNKKRDSHGGGHSVSNRHSSVHIPQFYFPLGQPGGEDLDAIQQRLREEFSKVEGGKVQRLQLGPMLKAMGIPAYWKCPMFIYSGGEKAGYVTAPMLMSAWKKVIASCHDESSRFMKIMSQPVRNYLEYEDFKPLIQDVVDTHPGLTFLLDAPEFHSRYVQTVISRIFYSVNRSWTGRVTVQELRRSNFLQTLKLLEDEEDINQITDFFSYEHFYVIYCKFWELDKDHDLYISKEDLARHNDHGELVVQVLSSRIIDRIFSGAVTRNLFDGKMSYRDFVWFLISEEDKRHPTSIEYWFRCMDLDGDGVISMYEMEYFYEEQVQKMEALGIETLPFEDCLCQMLDMVKPREEGKITLKDLKACKMTAVFYDTFFNLDKYLEHEQKDPFANVREHDEEGNEMSDWERYAAEEYEILVAEEGASEQQQDEIVYEDDFEPEDDDVPIGTDSALQLADPPLKKKGAKASSPDEDLYDFSNPDLGY